MNAEISNYEFLRSKCAQELRRARREAQYAEERKASLQRKYDALTKKVEAARNGQ